MVAGRSAVNAPVKYGAVRLNAARMAFDPVRPFILFDDARSADGRVRLYQDEVGRIEARTVAEVAPAVNALRDALAAGRHAAGYLSYEAGGAFEPRMASRHGPARPLLSFGLYHRAASFPWSEVAGLVDGRGTVIGGVRPAVDPSAHAAAVECLLRYIRAGDIYQANLTMSVEASIWGHPLALYARLREAQRMPHGALMKGGGDDWVLSASPELFFRLRGDTITARPMKGTAPRLPQGPTDRAASRALAADPKNRAENLMITDLIRNDLSRIAAQASVRVEAPFAVETYPTVHQMVTTVRARLAPEHDALDIVTAMFPCGSITGAPKIRAGQIIDDVEARARGLYTGSMGWLSPDGDAEFNVAIRTAELRGERLYMGVGAGIVADSDVDGEWNETLAKAAFLNEPVRPFHLIETMRFDPAVGVVDLERHMARLLRSAERFGFTCDRHTIRNLLQVLIGREDTPRRVRLTVSRSGEHALSVSDIPATPPEPLRVSVVPLPVSPDDWRLYHKVSDRGFYERARREAGTDEVVFARTDGFLTEGSFTNLFVQAPDGPYLTPPADAGLLPGILRERMLYKREAVEAPLTASDLRAGFCLGNALRGLMPARLVASANGAD